MNQKDKTSSIWHGDPDSLQQIWYSSLTFQEQLLATPENHSAILQLWDNSTTAPDWLQQDAIKDVKFISCLPRRPRLSNVFHAIGKSNEHLLVKLAKLDSENSGEPDAYAQKIANAFEAESIALKRIAAAKLSPEKRNQLPQRVTEGVLIDDQQRRVPYIVLKYIPGIKSVEDSAHQFQTAEEILRFMQDVCKLVNTVHRLGIVHGDLHLNNLFLSNNGKPVLLDFNASQIFSGSPLDRGFNQRDFGTQSNYDIQETQYPSRALSPAIDVLHLFEQLEWLVNSLHLRQRDKSEPSDSAGRRIDLDSDAWISAFVRLRTICTTKVPDYRPADAGELQSLLGVMLAGQPPKYEISYRRKLSGAIRTYPVESLIAVCFLALGLILGIVTAGLASYTANLREKDRASQWLSNNQLEAISLFSEDSIATEKREEKRNGLANRQNVANLLLAVPEGIPLQNKFLIPRLKFTLNLVKSRMEVDRFADNLEIVRRALKLAKRINGSTPADGLNSLAEQNKWGDKLRVESQCLEIQFLAILSRIKFELAIGAQRDNAASLLREAAAQYAAIHPDTIAKFYLGDLYIETGRVLVVDSHRPQYLAAWSKEESGRTGWSIAKSVLREDGNSLTQRGSLALAEIYMTVGLNFYQQAYPAAVLRKAEGRGAEGRGSFFYYDKADALLKTTINASSSDPQISSDCQIILAKLKAARGMRLTSERKYQKARDELSTAVSLVKKLASADPGSIALRRLQISFGWDLADTYLAEAVRSSNPEARKFLHRQSAQVRRQVLEIIQVNWSDEKTAQTRARYRVNAPRLAVSLFETGQDSEAIQILINAENSVGLETFDQKHGIGFDLAICLLKLIEALPNEPRYSSLLHQHSKRMVDRLDVYHKQLKLSAKSSTATVWRKTFEETVRVQLRKLDFQELSLASIPELEIYLRSVGISHPASTLQPQTP